LNKAETLEQKSSPIHWHHFLAVISLLISGCSSTNPSGNTADNQSSDNNSGILASVRPKASAEMVAQIIAQEKSLAKGDAVISNRGPLTGLNGLATRALPPVSASPIAPPAEEVAANAAIVSTANTSDNFSAAASDNLHAGMQTAPQSYGTVTAPSPGALSGNLIPPPPAVTLSTQAQSVAADPNNPYLNFNPFAFIQNMNPYGSAPNQSQGMSQRPAGLFGSGGKNADSASEDENNRSMKTRNFVPITPTGMEPRSAYKQRDDLRVLWKGLLASETLGTVDPRTLSQLNKLNIGLPAEPTRGGFSINQRQLNTIFKPNIPGIDKKMVEPIHKLQADLVQAYSRYLYAYNKFALAQQTVAARKQEVELADSPSERQKSTADLAQAQTELDSTRDDMRSAQIELAQATSPVAARSVIGKVSGVTPSLEALAINDKDDTGTIHKNKIASILDSVFSFGHPKSAANQSEEESTSSEEQKADSSADQKSTNKLVNNPKAKKESNQEKHGKGKELADDAAIDLAVKDSDKAADLTPAPSTSDSPSAKAVIQSTGPSSSVSQANSTGTPVTFTLKGVNVSTRKSVLTVSIKNAGADPFNFSPDVISVSDGARKLPDAAMRADFDSTFVQPNQEVKGTVTIFGRPWNDHLSVCLLDGGHAIQMKR
jgi:hypothetical protein